MTEDIHVNWALGGLAIRRIILKAPSESVAPTLIDPSVPTVFRAAAK